MRHIPTYRSWEAMKQRCNNPANSSYSSHGGRGITYVPEWEFYKNFLKDMGERPEGLTLDRIDNDDNYYKGNCRWTTMLVQNNNRRHPTIQTEPRVDTTSGVVGVSWHKRDCLWQAYGYRYGKRFDLYRGPNFLEACCARKSFESKELK